MNFIEKLTAAMRRNNSLVCVGLDPDPKLMPEGTGVYEFNKAVIDATADIACVYKPNFAFYEALGDEGIAALKATINYAPSDIPVIGDAKRGDIGNTSQAYATALFDLFRLDAATINPYLGFDGIEPFLKYADRGLFILCRTSNTGAADFQSLKCRTPMGERCLYEVVADRAEQWNTRGNIGLVVGATYPDEMKNIRVQHPSMPLLIPGVGAQGGEMATAVRYGTNRNGEGAVINSSRGIIYAGGRGRDFAAGVREAALKLRDRLNSFRPPPVLE
jgi:orotidine-5'-phosphate decarboxylase